MACPDVRYAILMTRVSGPPLTTPSLTDKFREKSRPKRL